MVTGVNNMTTYFKQGLDVTGNVNLTGNITVGGDQNFGDSDTDSITFTSDITSHILPNTTNTYDLGADGKAWRNVHTGTLVFEGSSEDTNETTLSVVNPTADRVIILPDESGTLATQAYVTSAVATKDDLSELSGTTDDVAEGSTNLFYTDTRVRAAVSATTGSAGYNSSTGAFSIPANTSHVTESGNLYYTDARADARIANNIIDEDNMATDSATRAPSQQSVKAYVDANSGGGGLGSVIEFGAISGGQSSTSTTRDFSMPIVVAPGQTVAGWSSYEAAPAIAWRDNYQGSPTVLGTTTYTNSTGSNVTVYARANTISSNVVGAHYMLFG